ncbi:MOSC domain-containing protein [Patulibacter minatonensis]|uniref:MOSC domain-containing protein n=1 Tax=Patulibacter minatonensis TaxID=298163 RepID=UPI00047D5B9C|nr:MOSC domain-containing protein [Patulibacter minatonensis]
MSAVLGTVATLFRFPVKSMLGERLEEATLEPGGLAGDRSWALLDAEDHWVSAKTNKARWRLYDGMLDLRATTVGAAAGTGSAAGGPGASSTDGPAVAVALPDGRAFTAGTPEADAALSAHLGRTLRFDHGDGGRRWGRHHDAAPLHLLTTATLEALASDDTGAPGEREALDPRRLRPNLVVRTPDGVSGFAEDRWIGTTFRVGGALLRAVETTGRCVMTTRAQGEGELPRDTTVLKRIGARNGADAGIYLAVLEPGRVALGDELRVLDPGPGMITG